MPDILIVLSGATDVRYASDGGGSVTYRRAEPHPATQTIEPVRRRLEGAGWKPVSEDFMNPGLTNSHARGWMDYIDGTEDDARVFVWSADWVSARGDVVRYGFTYTYTKGAGPMDARPPLEVSAIYMTAPSVNRIRSSTPPNR